LQHSTPKGKSDVDQVRWRIKEESIYHLFPHITKRILNIEKEDFKQLIRVQQGAPDVSKFTQATQDALKEFKTIGYYVARVVPNKEDENELERIRFV